MTDETENSLERMNDRLLQEMHALSREMQEARVLEAQGADKATIQAKKEAVTRKLQEMKPRIDELQQAMKEAQRKRT